MIYVDRDTTSFTERHQVGLKQFVGILNKLKNPTKPQKL